MAIDTASANLVVNGDFQAGNTGFTTAYSAAGIGAAEGTYSIVSNPFPSNPSATSYFDHTFGTSDGLMMAVNGATTPSQLVWGEAFSGLTIGQQYVFSLWLSSWFAAPNLPNATLDIRIGGVSRAIFFAPTVAGIWERRSFSWTATSSSIAFAAIFDTELAVFPNDFALDDIGMVAFGDPAPDELGHPSPVPEPSTYMAGAVAALMFVTQAIRLRRKAG